MMLALFFYDIKIYAQLAAWKTLLCSLLARGKMCLMKGNKRCGDVRSTFLLYQIVK